MSFAGKVILLTGASSGIGAYLSVLLAKEGAQLSLVGRSAEKFEKVVAKIRETGTKYEPLVILADISVDAARVVSETVDKYGRIDVLINNAGFSVAGPLKSLDINDFDNIMSTNVRAAILISQLATPHLVQSKGNLLNISSIAGLRPYPGFLAYCVSKSAMDQFTKCAALELAPSGVRVNSINPGFIDNEFHVTNGIPADQYEQARENFAKLHPIGRVGTCDNVSQAAMFLINEKTASFITGVCMPVDGGASIAQSLLPVD